MTKNYITPLLLCILAMNFSFGQDLEELDRKMNSFGTLENTKTEFEKNFFLDYKLAVGTEHMVFRETQFTLVENELDTNSWKASPYLFSIASFAIEPKLNLKRFGKNAMFFVKAPTGLSFSITTRSSYKIKRGFFHFNTGVLFGIGSGFHSTKTNVQKYGYAFSLGFQYFRAPLFGHVVDVAEEPFESGFGVERELIDKLNKNTLLPTLQFDLYQLSRKLKPRGYSLTLGMFRSFYIKFAMTILDKAD